MPPLSPKARLFLRDGVGSILQLDVILLLCRDDRRWWNAEQIAAELATSADAASLALEELAARNLFDVRIGSTLGYRFAPVDDHVRATLGEIAADSYAAREAVASGHRVNAARRFAEAFRLRNPGG